MYTVGHSNRKLWEFIGVLRRYNIRVVVDVRRFPKSRHVPWFSIHALSEALPLNGIGYVWLGRLLGGYRPGGYEKYMETDDFKEGVRELTTIISACNSHVAIMCREKLWFKCHRRYIADVLTAKGYKVIHIIEAGRLQQHRRRSQSRGFGSSV